MIRLSVITVTYNCIETVEQTINSVLTQDYQNIEYIVIDGASTDGTREIIEKYYDRIAYSCSEKDFGIYNAMNKGLTHVTGDVVLFLNGDDYFVNEQVVSKIVREFENSPQTEIIIGKERINGRVPDTYDPNNNQTLYVGVFFPHQATFAKKSVYEKIGRFDEQYKISADYDWILRACFNGLKIKWIDEVISDFKSGGRSASVGCVAEEFLISTKYLQMIGDKKMLSYAYKHYSREFGALFFWELINKGGEDNIVREVLPSVLDISKPLCIWGAGINGQLLIRFLTSNRIEVHCIFDSDSSKSGGKIGEIAINEYDGSGCFIVISSQDHEEEIAENLDEKGLNEGGDYIKYSTLAYELVKRVFDKHLICKEFYQKTGLNVLDYID